MKSSFMNTFNTAAKKIALIAAAVMLCLCVFLGLVLINMLPFNKTQTSAYRETLARVDAMTLRGTITDDGVYLLVERMSDIIFTAEADGDIDTTRAFKILSAICKRLNNGAVGNLPRLFEGRSENESIGLYEFMYDSMTEETAPVFAVSMTEYFAFDNNMDTLWRTAAVGAALYYEKNVLRGDEFTLPVYLWDDLKTADPLKEAAMNIAAYIDEYKNTGNLTGFDGEILYYRGAPVGVVGSVRGRGTRLAASFI